MRYWKCIMAQDDVGFTVGKTYTTDRNCRHFVDDNGSMYYNEIQTLVGVVFEEMVYHKC